MFSLARTSGSAVLPAAIANTKPLETTVVYFVANDDGLRMSGFTTIK